MNRTQRRAAQKARRASRRIPTARQPLGTVSLDDALVFLTGFTSNGQAPCRSCGVAMSPVDLGDFVESLPEQDREHFLGLLDDDVVVAAAWCSPCAVGRANIDTAHGPVIYNAGGHGCSMPGCTA